MPLEMMRHLGLKIKPGAPEQKVNPYDLPISEALKVYGLSQQARFGNVNVPKPPFYDIKGRMKWNAWRKESGQNEKSAADKAILLLEHILKVNNVQWKWGKVEEEYQNCLFMEKEDKKYGLNNKY